MSQEAEKISNYESEAVQKNNAVMKSKFAERYQRMQDRKNDRGVAPNFNTFVTNAVDKTSVAKKTSFSVVTMSGTAEIKSGAAAVYNINSYKGEPTDEQKTKVKWCAFIKGKWIPLTDIAEREDTNSDPLVSKTRYKEAILFCKIEVDKVTLKFSKWLDEKNVKVEAYRYKYGDKKCQQITKITAKPEVLSINWVNAKEESIKFTGYDQDVFLSIESIGLKDKELNLDILDYDKGGEDDKLDWGTNTIKITGRTTLKQFPIKKKTEYGVQQEDENKPGLDLYVVVNSSEPLENCKDKYATYLDLNPDEKIITAYFAEERKKEVQKGEGEKKKEEIETKPVKEPEIVLHTVAKKETLYSIAQKHGVSHHNKLKEYNELSTNVLRVGQVLKIPPKEIQDKPKTKKEQKDTKTVIYYQKIDAASLGSEVHLTAETQNLEGKKVSFTIFEKDPVLLTTKDTPLPLLINDEEKTEVEATVNDGKAQVKVILQRKEEKAQKEWKDILSPPEECIDGVWYDNKKDQDVKMADDDLRIVTEPKRYTPAIKHQDKKKSYLWLQVKCEGDQLNFDQPFLKKSGAFEFFYDASFNPWPVKEKFKQWTRRIDSGVGKRNVPGIKTASKNHKGLDINFSGGGNTDIGAPVYSTHDGLAHLVKDNTSGSGGRYIEIMSPDKRFMTRYLHLSKALIEQGQKILKGQKIGEIGASYYGKEISDKMKAHLHYEIRTVKNGTYDGVIDPTEGRGHRTKPVKLVDPQSWINNPESFNY